jgi:hypothetical protein
MNNTDTILTKISILFLLLGQINIVGYFKSQFSLQIGPLFTILI